MSEPIIMPGEISFVEEQLEFPVETTAFFHATSVLAEVREVFRRLAKKGCAWDEVEVIASNIKGIIDYLFEEEDGWVLVDLKTDSYDDEHEQN